MKNAIHISKCRLCHKDELMMCLDLGKTPLANEFLSEPSIQEEYPLRIVQCTECGHYQTDVSIDPEVLFKNYSYVSGTSAVNVKHFHDSAEEAISKFNLQPGELVVEIASNDATLLKKYQEYGMKVIGVEPAENLAQIANQEEILTLNEFFTMDTARKIIAEHGHPKLVIANNVIAHCNTLEEIAKGIKLLVGNKGYFTFEVSYWEDVVNHNLFDLLYHEHESQFNIVPLQTFFSHYNLKFFDVKKLPNHGGSIRGYVSGNIQEETTEKYQEQYNFELSQGMQSPQALSKIKEMSHKISILSYELNLKLKKYKQKNKKIAIYGVPAKATTLMYALHLPTELIDFAIDDAPLKQNTFTPGKHIKVLSSSSIEEHKPDVILILAWNFAESIIKNNPHQGTWLIPLPELKEVT